MPRKFRGLEVMFLELADSRVEVSAGFGTVVWLMETARVGSVIAWAVVRIMAKRIASRYENISRKTWAGK